MSISCQQLLKTIKLYSAFQPIFSFMHTRPVAFEALIRGRRGEDHVSPAELFQSIRTDEDAVVFEKACLSAHFACAYRQAGNHDGMLFLNVNPSVISEEETLMETLFPLISASGMNRRKIVIEIVEESVASDTILKDVFARLREYGCMVAIDDFGAGHSNFYRILELGPDIVKLDRTFMSEASQNSRLRRTLPRLVEFIHESGSLVLAEGIETDEQARLALDSNIDLYQGYLFGRPQAEIPSDWSENRKPLDLIGGDDPSDQKNLIDEAYFFEFRQIVAGLSSIDQLTREQLDPLLSKDGVLRCYLLDSKGWQIGEHVEHEHAVRLSRFTGDAQASWSKRPFYVDAIKQPGQLIVSRPYVSLYDIAPCLTISMAFYMGSELVVFCCDLDYAEFRE